MRFALRVLNVVNTATNGEDSNHLSVGNEGPVNSRLSVQSNPFSGGSKITNVFTGWSGMCGVSMARTGDISPTCGSVSKNDTVIPWC